MTSPPLLMRLMAIILLTLFARTSSAEEPPYLRNFHLERPRTTCPNPKEFAMPCKYRGWKEGYQGRDEGGTEDAGCRVPHFTTDGATTSYFCRNSDMVATDLVGDACYFANGKPADRTWKEATPSVLTELKCGATEWDLKYITGRCAIAKFSFIRCVFRETCDVGKLYFGECNDGFDCKQPQQQAGSGPISCEPSFQLQAFYSKKGVYDTIDGDFRNLQTATCTYENDMPKFEVTDKNGPVYADEYPRAFRCIRQKQVLFDDDCDMNMDNECTKGRKLMGMKTLDCALDYGLQAKKFGNDVWMDISEAILYSDTDPLEYKVTSFGNEFATHFRCIRKKLDNFIDLNDCEPDEYCLKPENCASLSCDTSQGPFFLQVKKTDMANQKWQEVESARCNSHNFNVKFAGKAPIVTSKVRVRCVRKKCTSCPSPCTTCLEGKIKQSAPVKWNECSEFSCGDHSHLVFGDNKLASYDFKCSNTGQSWHLNGDTEEITSVQCEYSCTKTSPISSICNAKDTSCLTIIPSEESNAHQCMKDLYFEDKANPRVKLSDMFCEKSTGEWKAKNKETKEEVVVPTGSNVFCHEGPCDEQRIFPSCDHEEKSDSICQGFDVKDQTYFCHEPATFWSRENVDHDWVEMDGLREMECRGGAIAGNGERKGFDFTATCRERKPSPVDSNKTGVYIAVTCFILVLIVIVITTILLRVTGKGWIHVIAMRWLKGRKKDCGSARSNSSVRRSSKASAKSPNASPSPVTPLSQKSRKSRKSTTPRRSRKSERKSTRNGPSRKPSTSASVTQASDDSKRKVKEQVFKV